MRSRVGRHAKPTKLLRSKCDSPECSAANASQFSVALRDTAPTELITLKLRMCRWTLASSASWRWARAMASRAAAGPPVPVPTSRPVSATRERVQQKRRGHESSIADACMCGTVSEFETENLRNTSTRHRGSEYANWTCQTQKKTASKQRRSEGVYSSLRR